MISIYAEPTALGLDANIWNLMWTGEETMKKGVPILKKKTGFRKRRRQVSKASRIYQGQQ